MNNTLITIIGTSISFIATTLGACIVFFLKGNISQKLNAIINGFSAGIMLAASIWGLLIPSFSYADYLGSWYSLPAIVGTILGCLFLLLIDIIVNNINKNNNFLQSENQKHYNLKKFVTAFTIHNIPEGMAIGFAFGNALQLGSQSLIASALGISIAIAVQNIPEGLAVALPVYKDTNSKFKGFIYGSLTGIVEPIFAVIGILLSNIVGIVLPWLLTFSAGTMIFVAVDDLIPNSKYIDSSHLGAWSFTFGFLIMMLLDVVLTV